MRSSRISFIFLVCEVYFHSTINEPNRGSFAHLVNDKITYSPSSTFVSLVIDFVILNTYASFFKSALH